MDEQSSTRAGRYIRQPTGYRAFIPGTLPPDPPFVADGALTNLLAQASTDLGRLDGLAAVLPNPDQFVAAFVRKEAVLSSQIEGTQASLDDLLEYEVSPRATARRGEPEVIRYVRAMNHGLDRLAGDFPLNMRLVREMHAVLLSEGRGSERTPGEFRTSQNWIGAAGCTLDDARFVPPPPHALGDALGNLEKFIHGGDPTPLLVRCALVHAQFETIHPFLDGNGRMGRLLITFQLCHAGVLARPLLYLSFFFKTHRLEYYDRLNAVRSSGDWEGWVAFFLRGVSEVSRQATTTAKAILELRTLHQGEVRQEMPRAATNGLRMLDLLFDKPFVTAAAVRDRLEISPPTAHRLLSRFEEVGLLREVTDRSRGRIYSYDALLELLREGTEPLPPG